MNLLAFFAHPDDETIIFDEVALDSESYHRVVPPVNGKMEDALIERLASTGLLQWGED
ncbi:MAG: hypothetical protein ACYC6H_00300 [Bellilinea sp.]